MTYKKTMLRRCACNNSRPVCHVQPAENKREEVHVKSALYFADAPSLAAVYGISQSWRGINDGGQGFERGTIFDELNKPFMGDKCKNGGYCK